MSLKRILLKETIETIETDWLIQGKYLFHYTHIDNLDSIMHHGLKKNKNRAYKDGCEGVFLTDKSAPQDANISGELHDAFEDNIMDGGEFYDEIIIKLWINVTKLNQNLFDVDDDYVALGHSDRNFKNNIVITGSVCYKDNIDKAFIEKIELQTGWRKFKDITNSWREY